MSRILTASKLVASVRKRAMIPTDTSVYTDEDILDILNEEMDAGLLSTLLVLHEEYLVNYEDTTLVSGKTKYPMPYRAIGNKLRDVSLVNSDNSYYELSRISLDQLSDYRNGTLSFNSNVFYVENNYVVLVDTNSVSAETIRQYFYLRPNTIVLEDQAGEIVNIDTNSGVLTLSSFPEDFANLSKMDFVSRRSPNKIYSYDIQPISVNVNTKTITFNPSDLPEELMEGDYVCIKEQTPVPNIPTEMHPLLAQRAATHILEALGDTEGLANAKTKLKQMEDSINNLVDDRVEGAPQKIAPRYTTLSEASNPVKVRGRRGIF